MSLETDQKDYNVLILSIHYMPNKRKYQVVYKYYEKGKCACSAVTERGVFEGQPTKSEIVKILQEKIS